MAMAPKVLFKRLCPHAILPRKATPGSAGYDIFTPEHFIILPFSSAEIHTGFSLEMQQDDATPYYGRIAPRSGLAAKHLIGVNGGVVDADYRGEIRVLLFNHSYTEAFSVDAGAAIAQLVFEAVVDVSMVEVGPDEELSETERGSRGFGSSSA